MEWTKLIRFNSWYKYPWEDGKYTQNERAILEDDYRDEFRMYGLMELMLEALSDKLLSITRNNTQYDIPICNIKDIYLTTDDCKIKFTENGHFYETDLNTNTMTARTLDTLEIKRPQFKII